MIDVKELFRVQRYVNISDNLQVIERKKWKKYVFTFSAYWYLFILSRGHSSSFGSTLVNTVL